MTRRILVLLVSVLLAAASSAHAQVAVLRIDPEAEALCKDVESALRGVGVVPDPGYLKEARAQDMDPTSDAALELITPLMQLKLAVVPLYVDEQGIAVEYRDGRTGARLGTATIAQERGALGPRGKERLRRDVVTHLATAIEGGSSPPPATTDGSAFMDPALEDPEMQREEPDPQRSITLSIRAGIGLGTRDVEWTTGGQTEQVAMGAFPAIDLGLLLAFRLSDAIWLVPSASYQSSLAFHEVEEPRLAAPAEKVGVRAHHFAATLGLRVYLGDEGSSASITPALGVGIRNLRPEVHHLSTPAYSLAGPLLQLGIGIPLSSGVALRIAPEAQWLFVGEGLRERDVEDTALSLGAEAAIAIEVLEALALELSYREAHALLSSLDGVAGDVERFITLAAVTTL